MQIKKYDLIYADPPWRYDFSISNSRKIENQYPTMSLEDICKLDIPANDNCILLLWTTSPKLEDAFKVLESWKFDYKTHLIWDKINIGMGYWFRNQHEILLVGTRGVMSPPNPQDRISSIFREKKLKHSQKPISIKFLIDKWYPKLTKIELFAREKDKNWDTFGNESPNDNQIRFF